MSAETSIAGRIILHLITPEGHPIRPRSKFVGETNLAQNWGVAAVIIATPFVIFGGLELVGLIRRRRYEALARRPKGIRRATSKRSRAG